MWSCLLWNLVYCNPGHPQDLHSIWNLICQIWLITIEIKFTILKIWDFKGLRSLIILYICNMHLLALKKLLYVDRLKPQKVLRFLPRSYKHVWRQILLIFSFCRNSVGKNWVIKEQILRFTIQSWTVRSGYKFIITPRGKGIFHVTEDGLVLFPTVGMRAWDWHCGFFLSKKVYVTIPTGWSSLSLNIYGNSMRGIILLCHVR